MIVEVEVAPVCNEGHIYRDHQFGWHEYRMDLCRQFGAEWDTSRDG